MLIPIDNNPDIDTDRDLSSAERHIVQKLFGWKTMVHSVAEFRQKKESALVMGWNNSGPIRESRALALVAKQLEKEIVHRLSPGNGK
ncbi:hypothetical protein FCL47_16350 [Desulfopila sp. IMCC35006]|uniref:hypothetical protein n=1 Tax=Desulfopila sp. IMCC35006 TaxID=2569542 RepID=UPI0010AD7AEE|nr:hypothetical protein [Desulfopila sp. IMCC35006]TKB24813.1 hypothetical protein FCL47_16350 [Desulfopila sp. IMCC35006]